MSNGFFRELESILDNEWIMIADACALFVGWCPLDDYTSNYGAPDEGRGYKRISDGAEVTPSKDDFSEMRFFQDKWIKLDFQIPSREPYINHADTVSAQVRVGDALKVGLGFRDERIDNLFDAAVEAGIIANEVGAIPKPKHLFTVEGNPKKPITKLIFRFCIQERDLGHRIPSAGDFLLWVHSTRPRESSITITDVTGKHLSYAENWALDDTMTYDLNSIRARLNEYCDPI